MLNNIIIKSVPHNLFSTMASIHYIFLEIILKISIYIHYKYIRSIEVFVFIEIIHQPMTWSTAFMC